MLTISSGHSASYLVDAVAAGRENYYTGAVAEGEPPGRWYGRGAEQLGLAGLVDAQDMTALYEHFVDPRDERFRCPEQWTDAERLGHAGRAYASEEQIFAAALDKEPDASGERRAELRLEAGKKARKNVAFLDATFSVQKSVTVLHTAFEREEVAARAAGDLEAAQAWGAHRVAVEDAIWAGNQAALDYLAAHAGYSRVGHHGGAAGRYIDAHDWTVASFFQHDSRNHDPQLHIHNAILNRVQGSDGGWRTLDGRSLYAHRGAAAAVGERTTEEHLTRSLGVRFATRPDGKAREIVGVAAEVMELFSSRRRAITTKTRQLVTAFETRFGRAPNSLELDRLQRRATFATRRAKSHHGESLEQRLVRWDSELQAEIATKLKTVATHALELGAQHRAPEPFEPRAVIETALADVQATKSGWTAPDLTRAISDALPDHLGDLAGEDLATLLDGLTADALELAVPLDGQRPAQDDLPDDLRLADGRSVYEAPGRRLYATPAHLQAERILLAATRNDGAAAMTPDLAQGFLDQLAETGIELGADQAATVRGVLTSGSSVECLVGPAGTGKSFVLGTLAQAWQDPDLWAGQRYRVVGLATSQIATEVLAGEGIDACNITRWLATQDRLADGGTGIADREWQLARGDLVVVDESAMTSTADLAAINRHATAAGAKLLLTGDHRQLAAVGAGGGMDLLATAGASYELSEARRFSQAWERDASLRLRTGEVAVLDVYHKHGRLLDCGTLSSTEQSAARAWLADTLDGKRSLLLVDTNEQAARLSAELRADLIRLGRVAEDGVPLGLQGTYAGVGDLIQARRNGWNLRGYDGNRRGPINREHYRVLATRPDGGLVVAPITGRGPGGKDLGEHLSLPASYVAEHVALGYATTVHSAQGLTVDTAHTVITPATGADALYVGMSRGRHTNIAHVTTIAVPADAPTGAVQDAVHRNPRSVLAQTLETAEPEWSALATATYATTEAGSVKTAGELFADATDIACSARTARWLDQLVTDRLLRPEHRAQIAGEDDARTLSTLLRRAEIAGHDPQQVLEDAVTDRHLDDARHLSTVLHHRITRAVTLDPAAATYTDRIPGGLDPQWTRYLSALADQADRRGEELGHQVVADAPQWAVEALGPVPTDPGEVETWRERAGIVAGHRELTGHDDPAIALGPPPKPGQAEQYASWRAAWRALGRPEADRDELEMSDGQLRLRIRAYEREQAWAPDYVAGELAGTTQAANHARRTAALRTAEADAATDAAQRDRLIQEAADARALADTLDHRIAQLRFADEARATWLLHTADTRAAADRATAELSARHAADDIPAEPAVTADEWLAEHRAAVRDDDRYRTVTELDLTPEPADDRRPHGESVLENQLDDARDLSAGSARAEDDTVRVPTPDETAQMIARAQRALLEIRNRQVLDAQHERAAQLAHWHTSDRAAEREQTAGLESVR